MKHLELHNTNQNEHSTSIWALMLFLCLNTTYMCSQPIQPSSNNNNSTLPDSIDRVAIAQQTTGIRLRAELENWGAPLGAPVFLRAFKHEKQLELWVQKDTVQFALFKTYTICQDRGTLGPKRKQGDLQVPEGVYWIDVFNPKSSFHLSLRINYPNASDLHFSDKEHPGGEIYLHGGCASTGCIPIQDPNIEEVYLLALAAKNNGQINIPVHIFPCRMTDRRMDNLIRENLQHRFFWENLQPVFYYFEEHKILPEVVVDENGRYQVVK